MKPILACTDGSQYAPSVYDHAAWAARRGGSSVRVLHVLERDELVRGRDLTGSLGFDAGAELMEELVQLDESHARVARLRGKAVLENAKRHLSEFGVTEVEALQRHGALVDTVEEFEENAEVVVIGKRGEHADFAKGHLGSNLERVVRSAKIPVMVASRAFKSIDSVLIAFDGGSSSLKAVLYAASNPLLKGLKCHLISVGKPGSEVARELENAATGLKGAGFEVESQLFQGHPEEIIKREAEARKVDLLVMGAYGHSRIRRLLIGSTTTALVRECHIPVLLFR